MQDDEYSFFFFYHFSIIIIIIISFVSIVCFFLPFLYIYMENPANLQTLILFSGYFFVSHFLIWKSVGVGWYPE